MPFKRGQLDYFVAVINDGQMTSAARRLRVAQPALSQAIAQLEDEVGLKLLERHSRGVRPTAAGEALYEKALLALAAIDAAESTAHSLARAQQGTIEFGFVGAPPSLDSRVEMEAFGVAYPEIRVHYRELCFPTRPTASWLSDVDIAVSHTPPPDDAVWRMFVRNEPRVALVPSRHRLAACGEARVEDIIDDTFVGFAEDVDPVWAGFWSLDDHRGGRPASLTGDRACNPQEVLAALAGSSAITLVPAAAATILSHVLTDVRAVPLRDVAPARIELVGHADDRNPLVGAMRDFAARSSLGAGSGGPG